MANLRLLCANIILKAIMKYESNSIQKKEPCMPCKRGS